MAAAVLSLATVSLVHGWHRLQNFVENAGRLVLITAAGDRFPIRESRDADPDPAME